MTFEWIGEVYLLIGFNYQLNIAYNHLEKNFNGELSRLGWSMGDHLGYVKTQPSMGRLIPYNHKKLTY